MIFKSHNQHMLFQGFHLCCQSPPAGLTCPSDLEGIQDVLPSDVDTIQRWIQTGVAPPALSSLSGTKVGYALQLAFVTVTTVTSLFRSRSILCCLMLLLLEHVSYYSKEPNENHDDTTITTVRTEYLFCFLPSLLISPGRLYYHMYNTVTTTVLWGTFTIQYLVHYTTLIWLCDICCLAFLCSRHFGDLFTVV